MKYTFFVTGTDTEVGKTYCSVGLLKAFNQLGYRTLGIKPLASGAKQSENKFYNEDALALQQASSVSLDYCYINPIVFAPAIAPHIAAARLNGSIDLQTLVNSTEFALHANAEVKIVEGAGGWYTPLNTTETLADFVQQQQMPVILVVAIKLGCINHALLTQLAIEQAGCRLVGWIANCPQPSDEREEIIDTLVAMINAPLMGVVAENAKPEACLRLDAII